MTVLKRVGPLSFGKVQGLVGVIFGLIIGIIFAVVGAFAPSKPGLPGFGFTGVFAVVGFPILYGIFGFLGGLIGAWIYNLVAKWIGGVELDLEHKS